MTRSVCILLLIAYSCPAATKTVTVEMTERVGNLMDRIGVKVRKRLYVDSENWSSASGEWVSVEERLRGRRDPKSGCSQPTDKTWRFLGRESIVGRSYIRDFEVVKFRSTYPNGDYMELYFAPDLYCMLLRQVAVFRDGGWSTVEVDSIKVVESHVAATGPAAKRGRPPHQAKPSTPTR